jgi:hypothetical protein
MPLSSRDSSISPISRPGDDRASSRTLDSPSAVASRELPRLAVVRAAALRSGIGLALEDGEGRVLQIGDHRVAPGGLSVVARSPRPPSRAACGAASLADSKLNTAARPAQRAGPTAPPPSCSARATSRRRPRPFLPAEQPRTEPLRRSDIGCGQAHPAERAGVVSRPLAHASPPARDHPRTRKSMWVA